VIQRGPEIIHTPHPEGIPKDPFFDVFRCVFREQPRYAILFARCSAVHFAKIARNAHVRASSRATRTRACLTIAPSFISCATWRSDVRPMTPTRPAGRTCMHQIRTAPIAAPRLSNGLIC